MAYGTTWKIMTIPNQDGQCPDQDLKHVPSERTYQSEVICVSLPVSTRQDKQIAALLNQQIETLRMTAANIASWSEREGDRLLIELSYRETGTW
jgi:hypothetical protein